MALGPALREGGTEMAEKVNWIARQGRLGVLFALSACLTAGCGSEETEAKRVPSMLGNAPAAKATGENEAPIVVNVSLHPARPAPGRTVNATAEVTDADGDRTKVTYVWRTSAGRMLGHGRALNTSGLAEGERLQVTVTATDGDAESEARTVEFQLSETSVVVAFVAIDDSEGSKPGSILRAVVESTDESAGGYETLYEWRVGDRVVGTDDELDTADLMAGDRVTLVARLEFEDHTTASVRGAPVVLARGDGPTIVSNPRGGIEAGIFRYQMRATSGEPGATIRYEVLEGPEGLAVNESSGLVTWRPTRNQQGAFKIELAAKDQWGTGVAQGFEIRVDPPGAPPASAR